MARPPLEDFLDKGRVYTVRGSSWVRRVSYDDEEESLLVTCKGGTQVMYLHISELEARSFWFAASKGRWIWTNIRVRGSQKSHQKPYYIMEK